MNLTNLATVSADTPLRQGFVNKEGVNVRADASVYSMVLATLHKGERISIAKEQPEWYKIIIPANRVKAFIHSDYLERNIDGFVTNANQINIRTEPTLSGLIIGTMPKDTVVSVFEKKENFYSIEPYPYAYGWIHKNFLTFKNQENNFIPVQTKTPDYSENTLSPQEHYSSKTEQSPPKEPEQNQISGMLKRLTNKKCNTHYIILTNDEKKIPIRFKKPLNKQIKSLLNQFIRLEGKPDITPSCDCFEVEKIKPNK